MSLRLAARLNLQYFVAFLYCQSGGTDPRKRDDSGDSQSVTTVKTFDLSTFRVGPLRAPFTVTLLFIVTEHLCALQQPSGTLR